METDARLGLPSASAFESYALCPGKYSAEKDLPQEESPWAHRGTELHQADTDGDVLDLDPGDAEFIAKSRGSHEIIVEEWLDDIGVNRMSLVEQREKRLFYRRKGQKLFSGQADYQAICTKAKAGLIVDLKTGWLGVPPSESNLQLRVLAVLLARNYDLEIVRVAINQPNRKKGQACDYDLEALAGAESELLGIIHRVMVPDAPRYPGTRQCKFCRAKKTCPPALAVAFTLQQPKWELLAPEQKFRLWNAATLALDIADKIKAAVKADLEKGVVIPGLALKPTGEQRKITDPQKVWETLENQFRLNQKDFSVDGAPLSTKQLQQLFVQTCQVGLGPLADLYRKITGCTKKAANDWINSNLEHCIESKDKSPSVILT